MATKEAVFKLRVDTGNSVADINAADKAIQGFNKDLQTTKTIQADSTGSDNFAAKLAAIDQKVKAGGLGIRELSRVIREYQSVAIAAGEESVVGRQAIAQAGALKDRIGDLQSQTKVASSDFKNLDLAIAGIGTGAAVFQGLTGAIALTGIENEELTKTMVKLQAAQGIANAVNQVALALNSDAVLGIQLRIGLEKVKNFVMGESASAAREAAVSEGVLSGANTAVGGSAIFASGALKALKVAMITTGVGALVVGVGFLVSKFMEASEASDKLKKAQKAAADAAKEQSKSIAQESGSFTLLISRLKDTNNGSVERKKLIKEVNATYGTTFTNLKDETKFQFALNQELKNYLAYQRAKYELQKNEKLIIANLEKQDEINRKLKESQNNLNKAVEEGAGKQKKTLEEGIITYVNLNDEATKIAENERENIKNLTKARDEAEKRFESYGGAANDAGAAIADLTNEGKKFIPVEQSKTDTIKEAKDAIDAQNEALAKAADIVQDKLSRETSAIESAEDLKISMMNEGKAKQLAILDETYGDFRDDLIKKANKNEIDAIDEKLKLGTLTEQQYRDELKVIMETGSKNFNDAENLLMTLTTTKLNEDKRRLSLSAQELEIDDINKSFDQKDLTEEQRLIKIQEINDKYAKIDKDKAAKNETEKRNTAKFLNDIMLNEQENALANIEFEDIDAKARLLELLNSTNANEKITQKQHDDALIKLEEEKQKKIKGIKEKGTESAKAIAKQQFEEDNQGLINIIEGAQKAQAFANEINAVINQAAEQKIQETNNRRDAELASLDAQQAKELSQAGLTAEQKTAIEEKFAIAKYNVQKKAFDQEDKLNRAKFNREKAMKMTSIVISTAEAVVKSLAENGGAPAGIPFAIATGALGAAQLAVVAASKYQGGTAPSMPSFSSGGGSTGASGEQFAPTTPATTTATAGLLGNGSNTPTTGQVFVLESDISQVQNNVMVAEQKSKF
ncbi:hypothetical protein UFOVP522_22 [uncultured Caudovirales phage]|uniref:Uncharacterized protein n=1 Tax=uncultured Caudovirales phage TaxID=2100421 RepID=A0A6J5N6H7_9CAUD|nr:hypothetical protein UFOVP522_22 [uncultured Caudovirales phage]CAB4154007.1 hypothetical protein UFOVP624_49 [uncultured Caudovirales phage]CAB4188362.1 hypothetical protein UFOVP1178_16 [uncultured Caudovirales phage]